MNGNVSACKSRQPHVTVTCVILSFVVVLCGCQHTYQRVSSNVAPSRTVLDPQRSAYLAMPADGQFQEIIYRNSGTKTAFALQSSFAHYLRTLNVARTVESVDQAIASAKRAECDLVIFPTILHWEDRATEWSGRPDKIEIKVELFNVANTNLIDATLIKGKSRWFTLGGDAPEDLLERPIEDYVRSLLGLAALPVEIKAPNAPRAGWVK
jgi:hypothetical protein